MDAQGERRIRMLAGDTLDPAPDHVLEGIVAMVAVELGGPWTCLTLLLDRTLVLRAHRGMPDGLAIPRSMEAVGSFCEQVVRDEVIVEIEDSLASPTTQLPFDRWGVRSYLGAPVYVGDVCVGTLCAIDPQPRRYDPALRPRLLEWAARASARLAELARRPSLRRGGVQHVLRPSFAEIGNSLTPVFGQLGDARTTLDALIAERDDERNEESESLQRLRTAMRTVEQAFERIHSTFASLQLVLLGSERIAISELARTSDELARHHTKLVGGVRWEVPTREVVLEVSHCTAVTVVASALSLMAMDMNRGATADGIHAGIFHRHRRAEIILAAGLRTAQLEACAARVGDLVNREEIDVSADPGGIRILLPAA